VFLDPDFVKDEKILAIRFKADIGLLIFAWIFWPEMGVFVGKIGEEVVRC